MRCLSSLMVLEVLLCSLGLGLLLIVPTQFCRSFETRHGLQMNMDGCNQGDSVQVTFQFVATEPRFLHYNLTNDEGNSESYSDPHLLNNPITTVCMELKKHHLWDDNFGTKSVLLTCLCLVILIISVILRYVANTALIPNIFIVAIGLLSTTVCIYGSYVLTREELVFSNRQRNGLILNRIDPAQVETHFPFSWNLAKLTSYALVIVKFVQLVLSWFAPKTQMSASAPHVTFCDFSRRSYSVAGNMNTM